MLFIDNMEAPTLHSCHVFLVITIQTCPSCRSQILVEVCLTCVYSCNDSVGTNPESGSRTEIACPRLLMMLYMLLVCQRDESSTWTHAEMMKEWSRQPTQNGNAEVENVHDGGGAPKV